MTSTSSYVPVTVSILVPIDVGAADLSGDEASAVCGRPVASLTDGSDEAKKAAQAVAESDEVRNALELLLAAVARHRVTYPLAPAVATPWFGTVPESEV